MKKIFLILSFFAICLSAISCASTSAHETTDGNDDYDYEDYGDWWEDEEDSPISVEHGTVKSTDKGYVYENKDVGLGLLVPSSSVVLSGSDLDGMQKDPSTLLDLMAIVSGNYVHAVSISDGGEDSEGDDSFANSSLFVSILESLLVSGWENSGIHSKEHGIQLMKFLGKEVYGVYFNGDVAGQNVWYYVVCKQKGRLIASVILGAQDRAGVESMLEAYYELPE